MTPDADRIAYDHARHAFAVAEQISNEAGGALQDDIRAARAVKAGYQHLAAIALGLRLRRIILGDAA